MLADEQVARALEQRMRRLLWQGYGATFAAAVMSALSILFSLMHFDLEVMAGLSIAAGALAAFGMVCFTRVYVNGSAIFVAGVIPGVLLIVLLVLFELYCWNMSFREWVNIRFFG